MTNSTATIQIAFLCTYASNGLNQHGMNTTMLEGVWVARTNDTPSYQTLTVETGQELLPTLYPRRFHRVESACFGWNDQSLHVENAIPTRIIDPTVTKCLTLDFHELLAKRQRLFLSDEDELRALGLMLTEHDLVCSLVRMYADYVFSSPGRQCLFVTIQHLVEASMDVSMRSLAETQHCEDVSFFDDNDVGMAVNAAMNLTEKQRFNAIYRVMRTDVDYDDLKNDEAYLKWLGLRVIDE